MLWEVSSVVVVGRVWIFGSDLASHFVLQFFEGYLLFQFFWNLGEMCLCGDICASMWRGRARALPNAMQDAAEVKSCQILDSIRFPPSLRPIQAFQEDPRRRSLWIQRRSSFLHPYISISCMWMIRTKWHFPAYVCSLVELKGIFVLLLPL